MNLKEYPGAIAKLQIEVLDFDLLIEQTHSIVKEIEAEVDTEIAFDTNLRNDAQRKAKRQQLLDEHSNYWEKQETLTQYRRKRELIFIELCQYQNEFSVLKLERREAIARLELQANS